MDYPAPSSADNAVKRDSVFAVLRRIRLPYRLVVAVTLLTIAFALTEGAGIGMLLPVLVFVESGESAFTGGANPALSTIASMHESLGLSVSLISVILLAVIPLLLRQLVYYFKSIYTAKAQNQFALEIRHRSIRQFLGAGLPFYIRNSHGEVVSTLLIDASQASTIVTSIIEILGSSLLLIAYLGVAMVLSPPLTLMAAPIFIFCGWVIRFQLVRGRNFGRLITDNNTAFSEIVNEAMQGIRLLKMRSFEKTTAQRLYERAKTVAYSNIDLQRIRSGLEATAQPFLIIGTFGVLYIAVQHLDMRLAELGMFMLLIARATPLLIQINSSRLAIHGSIESHLRIDRMSAAAAAVPEAKSGNKPFTGMTSGIEFDRVSFSYDRDDVKIPALRGVSFVAAKGKTLALVGPSGAGKSTLVDLIPRFHEPQSGAVKIDGDPIESFELSSLRQRIAFVTQETVLFHASIRGNIEIGLAEPLSDAKLRECLEKSHCTEFVDRLPQGVETEIGERGMQLSGGQRQRLALARALAQDSEVLVLDEPTSALDSISEAAIQASLDALRGQMTVIVIAHRLATIRHADLIVVLDEGKVVGRGTHESLMANTGTYRDLVDMQRL